MVEHRALSNVGDPYHLGADNCEHDMTFAQTGRGDQLDREHRPWSRHSSASASSPRTNLSQTESPATSPVSQSLLSIEVIEFDLIEEDEGE